MSCDGSSTLVMVQGYTNDRPSSSGDSRLLDEMMIHRRGRRRRSRNGGGGGIDLDDDGAIIARRSLDDRISNNLKRLTKADRRRLFLEVKELLRGEMSLLGDDDIDEHEDESTLALSSSGDGRSGSTGILASEFSREENSSEESGVVWGGGGGADGDDNRSKISMITMDDDGTLNGTCDPLISFVTCCFDSGKDDATEYDEIPTDEEPMMPRGRRRHRVLRAKLRGRRRRAEDPRRGGRAIRYQANHTRAENDPLDHDRTVDPPGIFASDSIDVEMTVKNNNEIENGSKLTNVDYDGDDEANVTNDTSSLARAESPKEERPTAATVTNGTSSLARPESHKGEMPTAHVTSIAKPTLLARVKSATTHRSSMVHDIVTTSDENAATTGSLSLVVPDEPETLGRAKSFTLHRWKYPFVRAGPSNSDRASNNAEYVPPVAERRDGATNHRDPSSGTTNQGRNGIETFGVTARSNIGSSRPARKNKEAWWEYTDERCGKKYYSNGVISTWERPIDVQINVAPSSPVARDGVRSSRMEMASIPEKSNTTTPSMERRDRQDFSSSKEGEKRNKSTTTQDWKESKSFFMKEKATRALATSLGDTGGFRRALALSGRLGNNNRAK